MVGFETFNPISNLGGIYVLIMIFFIRLALLLISLLIKKVYKKREGCIVKNLVKLLEKLTKNLIFESFILLINGSIIHLTMTALLFLYSPKVDTSIFNINIMTNIHSNITGYFSLVFGLIVIPLLFECLIMFKPYATIDRRIREIIGGLLDKVKTGTKLDAAFNLIFVGRRIVLCFVGFFLKEYSA